MPKIPSRPALDLSGKWAVELPSLPDDYLAQTPDPHVLIRHEDFYRFTATYQFGTQRGEIDGRVDEVWPNAAQLFLTFAGLKDGEDVFGAAGDAGYNAKEEDIINGTFRYHHGDDLPFVWKRIKRAKPARIGDESESGREASGSRANGRNGAVSREYSAQDEGRTSLAPKMETRTAEAACRVADRTGCPFDSEWRKYSSRRMGECPASIAILELAEVDGENGWKRDLSHVHIAVARHLGLL